MGVSCPLCSAKTYTVSGIEKARAEDHRLVKEALEAFGKPVDEVKEDGVKVFKALRWVEHSNPSDDVDNFVSLFLRDKRWEEERFKHVLQQSDKEELIELSKMPHVRHVQRDVARLWATLTGQEDHYEEKALGPLSKLTVMCDAVFDAILRAPVPHRNGHDDGDGDDGSSLLFIAALHGDKNMADKWGRTPL